MIPIQIEALFWSMGWLEKQNQTKQTFQNGKIQKTKTKKLSAKILNATEPKRLEN